MKWSALAVSLFAASGLASPMFADLDVYTLRLSSTTKSLNGKYLGVNGTLVGVYKETSVVKFIAVPSSEKPSFVELHTYPIGKVDRALALVGKQGLLDFTDVTEPSSVTVPKGTTCDWTSFSLGEKTLKYGGSKAGGWVAFPTGKDATEWSVKWKDASAITIQNYMPVDVVYETTKKTETTEFGTSD
ncbi:hypothetical protein B0H63DRAFT_458687 [Podospora didyma]|uniref:Uncharacterized protein n=1 Tax=Podospora didyma TaxID=330526 RepID=A0AAE0U7A2_9PEZI|nr:hypothetical protein B0H63DRAFT_458687 [Podospora didyma]